MFSITCDQQALHESVQTVSGGVSGRSTQPIQNNILLEASGEQLMLVATDLEYIGIRTAMPVSEAEEGQITVQSRILTDVTGSLPRGPVTLTANENSSVRIVAGHSDFNIRGLPADDFQKLPALDDAVRFTMPAAMLLGVLRRTVFATSTDETRPILTGALLKISGTNLATVATDTYRLALYETQLETEVERDVEAIVSRRALREVEQVVSAGSTEEVEIGISSNQIEFVIGETIISSRLIEGQFVNYPKVIPTGVDKRITAPCEALKDTLQRALVVARQDAYRVVLRAKDGVLTVNAQSQDVGKVEETLGVAMEGEEAEIAFNGNYLMEMLDAAECDELTIELSGPLNSGLLHPADDEGYLYVLMPMQIMA